MSTGTQIAGRMADQSFFDLEREVVVARAPGRLDLMGGNVDYTGGLVLQSVLRESIWAAVQLRHDRRIRLHNPGAGLYGWETDVELDIGDLDSAEKLQARCSESKAMRWVAYVAGGLHLLRQRGLGFTDHGAEVYIYSDLPPNKGVSSSAALEIALLKAASGACGTPLAGSVLAEAGQWVENEIAQSACGIMDQAAIVFGKQNMLLPLLCQPLQVLQAVPLPRKMRLWGIDSMSPRATDSLEYERARAAAFIAYTLLCDRLGLELTLDHSGAVPRWRDSRWNGYLSTITSSAFQTEYESYLPEALSGASFLQAHSHHADPFTVVKPDLVYPVRAAARYAVEENERVRMFLATIPPEQKESGDSSYLGRLGKLMYQSHDAYRECGLGSERCDELVDMVRQAGPWSGLHGAKMTGGGGGGTVVILGTEDGVQALDEIVDEYGRRYGKPPYVFTRSSAGADDFSDDVLQRFVVQAR